jgi:hypothetical protein
MRFVPYKSNVWWQRVWTDVGYMVSYPEEIQYHTVYEKSDFEQLHKLYFEITGEEAPRMGYKKLEHAIQTAGDRKKRLEREALGLSKRAYNQLVEETIYGVPAAIRNKKDGGTAVLGGSTGKYAWNYIAGDGCVYAVDPVSGSVLSRSRPVAKAGDLPRDLIEAAKAAKISVRVDGKPLS